MTKKKEEKMHCIVEKSKHNKIDNVRVFASKEKAIEYLDSFEEVLLKDGETISRNMYWLSYSSTLMEIFPCHDETDEAWKK